MVFRFIAAIFVSIWVFWQIAVSSTDEIRLPELSGLSEFKEDMASAESPALVFFRRMSPGQYTAYGMNAAGGIVRAIRLPGDAVQKADQTKISLAGKEGYITAPENGAYYIWYPQIGTQVFVFNEQGTFLWEKEESHYLNVLPRGRYIMAAAGDQSRLLFMNPDFKMQADFQGVLFTRFQADDNPDLKTAQVCLGSLDGEIIVAHLDRKLYFRHKLGYALKSLQCDFESGEAAAIIERTVEVDKQPVQKDFLVRMKFSLNPAADEKSGEAISQMRMVSANIDTVHTSELPVLTTTASPLVLTNDSICFLQDSPSIANAPVSAADSLGLYLTTGRKSALRHLILPAVKGAEGAVATDYSPDLWRAAPIRLGKEQGCLFSHRSGRLLIANKRGIVLDRNDLPAERMLARGDAAYLQNATGIITLR